MSTMGKQYGSELVGIYRERAPRRAVVQYRHEPYCAPGIRTSWHYGRGVPVRYSWLPGGPDRVEDIAEMIRRADSGIAPESVTTVAPLYPW